MRGLPEDTTEIRLLIYEKFRGPEGSRGKGELFIYDSSQELFCDLCGFYYGGQSWSLTGDDEWSGLLRERVAF